MEAVINNIFIEHFTEDAEFTSAKLEIICKTEVQCGRSFLCSFEKYQIQCGL